MLACKPADKKTLKTTLNYPFSCLSSQSNCQIETEYGNFSVTFSGSSEQGRLKTELPFLNQILFNPSDKRYQLMTIQSYFEGKTMFMGKVPVFFEQSTTENMMNAQTLLASCSEEVMTWRMWLTLEIAVDDEIKKESTFIDFESKRL